MFDETFHVHDAECVCRVSEIRQARGLFCLSWAPTYPGPPFIAVRERASVLLSSLITVDEQPCVSSYFLSADDRPRPPGSQWFQTRFDARTRAQPSWTDHWNKVHGLCPLNGISVRALARNWELGIITLMRMDAPMPSTCRCSISLLGYFDISMLIPNNNIDALWQLLISNIPDSGKKLLMDWALFLK